ncbi:MAG TPA: tRNA lysidine(34) synthetase TilS, partial [Longimicrobiaceae bacterium]|nr:tRNA lysidine(34) synthetase TilS [Longimicrobiaceae bacterium]
NPLPERGRVASLSEPGGGPLEARFLGGLDALGLRGAHVLAAVSGGSDSVALLHLLRFAAREHGLRVSAAHFDHAMRPDSAADARWVQGLCAAWEVPLLCERAAAPLRTEEEAREARYAFLRRAQREAGATHLATAHHADDQAETVLFRVLRGTGPAGLAGIPASGPGGIVRPLLPFWKAELRRYARSRGLRWRPDPTNRSTLPARNRIRRELLPLLERSVAPGARRNLVRLAALAAEDEAAWDALLAGELAAVAREEDGAVVLVRERLSTYDSAVAARLLRTVLRRFGIVLDRTGTRSALQFISTAPSGRELMLPGRVRIATEYGAARVERLAEAAPPPDRPLVLAGPHGEARVRIGGRERTVAWRTSAADGAAPADPASVELPLEGLRAPLTLRGRRPGDRIRTAGGTKTLKKLLAERRVPRSARAQLPVLADADGAVLWVPGVARAAGARPEPGQTALTLTVSDA